MAESPTREVLVEDLQNLINKTDGVVTRDYYRANGTFSERSWRNHFGSFTAFKSAAKGKEVPVKDTSIKQSYSEGKWEISLSGTRIKSLPEMIKQFEIDEKEWVADKFTCTSHEMGAMPKAVRPVGTKDWTREDTEPIIVPLYNVSGTFIKRIGMIRVREEIEDLKAEAKQYSPKVTKVVHEAPLSGNCLELLVPDLHAMKMSWGKETGYGDWDLSISIETYQRAVDSLLQKAVNYSSIDRIMLGVGNDLLQVDNNNSSTTKGTRVDTDTRFKKGYKIVRKMLVETIEKLRTIAPVTVKVVPGNHDAQSSFTIGDSLECWFHNFEDVEIDNTPIERKLFRWGNNLLLLTHGDKGKKSDYGLWLATEYPKEFGETKFREIHIGHLHGVHLEEKYGIRVRQFAALCEADYWHSSNGLVGNLRTAEGLLWNKDLGLVATFIHTETN